MNGAFGQYAGRVAANGFEPIPITLPSDRWAGKAAGKRPAPKAWEKGCPDLAAAIRRYRDKGLGCLTRRTPGVDIDVRHAAAAEEIDRLVMAKLGGGPLRVGAWPKRLRLFRAATPFTKIRSAEFTMPGDDPNADGYKPHAVEIMGDGQQIVCFGIHPGTRRAYQWPGVSPLTIRADELPTITEEQGRAFVAAAEDVLRRHGGAPYRPEKPQREGAPTAPRTRPGAIRAALYGAGSTHGQRAADLARLASALDAIPNAELHYDDWVEIGLALKGACGPEHDAEGERLWCAWSARSSKDDPAYTLRKWRHEFGSARRRRDDLLSRPPAWLGTGATAGRRLSAPRHPRSGGRDGDLGGARTAADDPPALLRR